MKLEFTKDLQPMLLGLMLERLVDIFLMQEGQEMMNTQQGNIPRLILAAVCWLDKIVSGDGLTVKMVEVLDATSRYHLRPAARYHRPPPLKDAVACGTCPLCWEILLCSCTRDDCSMVVQDLWDSLDLTVRIRPPHRPGSPKKKMLEKNKSMECIILDKISMAMSTDKWMGDAWLSAVESVHDVLEVKPLDLLLLLESAVEEDGGEHLQEQDQGWALH